MPSGKKKRVPGRPDIEAGGQVIRDKFLEHLAQTGNVVASCAMAGTVRQTMQLYRGRHPEFAEAWAEAMAKYNGNRRIRVHSVEEKLFEAADAGDVTAILAILKAWKANRYNPPKQIEQKGEVEHTHTIKVIRQTTVKTHAEYQQLLADRAKLAVNGNGNGHH